MYEVLITDLSLRSKTKSNMINVNSINNDQKQSTLSMITVISTQGMKWYTCIYKSILSQFGIGTWSYCKLSYKWNITYNLIHIYWKYSLQNMLNVYDYIQQNISRIQENITLSDQLYCKH